MLVAALLVVAHLALVEASEEEDPGAPRASPTIAAYPIPLPADARCPWTSDGVVPAARANPLVRAVVHGEISAALDKAFSSHPVWPFVHHDVHGKTGTSGTTTTRLTFFAVNNVKGRGDPVVLRLLNVMQVYPPVLY